MRTSDPAATRPDQPEDLVYDPYDYDIDRDPHPTWKRMRDEAPLYLNERLGFYALSRYQDVLDALVDWQTFASGKGTVLELIDADDDHKGLAKGFSSDDLGQMIFTDPPGHDVARRVVNRSFTPRAVGDLEQRIRDLCRLALDAADPAGFDFLEDFAGPIPAMVIGQMLGVPETDQRQLGTWVDMFLFYDPAAETGDEIQGVRQFNPTRAEGLANLSAYIADMVADRRRSPREDMVSHLLDADVALEDGSSRKLTTEEVLGFFMLLQAAGSETTARMLGWAGVLLARHPDQRERLVERPGLIPNAVEELLRYEAPSPIQARSVTRDVELHGVLVPAGSKLALLNGSAGRDDREYPDPDRFDVERRMERHLTFGYSTHFCLGAALARLEGRVILEEVLARYPTWDVDEDRVELVHTTTVRGPARVPITR